VMTHGTTHSIAFDDFADGNSKLDKFERDAQLLQGDLDAIDELERRAAAVPSDAALESELADHRLLQRRSVFYLARTWRDMGAPEKSLEAYTRRASMGGWAEEVWYSLYEGAKLSERLKFPPETISHRYLAAYEYRPQRAEPLVQLARFHRERKQFALAHLFALRAINISKPHATLFLDTACYEWRAMD